MSKPFSDIQVQYETNQDSAKTNRGDLRITAKKTLLQLLEPLAGFVADSGLSASDLYTIFREASVRCAASKQLEFADRVNISGIAASTGIPRADVSRILKIAEKDVKKIGDTQQQTTNRVLAAWHEDPKFAGPNGQPLDLNIYGRGITFEALTKKYGRGIPVRAVLDELMRAGAVELLSTQKIRAIAAIAIDRGMSARAIKAFGDRASELLSTMLFNMRQPEESKFIANVADSSFSSSSLPLLRREVSVKGADFLAGVQEVFARKPSAPTIKGSKRGAGRVSVTVFYSETFGKTDSKKTKKRRNFRREA